MIVTALMISGYFLEKVSVDHRREEFGSFYLGGHIF